MHLKRTTSPSSVEANAFIAVVGSRIWDPWRSQYGANISDVPLCKACVSSS
jgi:hypothetical protein